MGLANADHTTLLLNTYTKLKDVGRLDSFIKTESRRGESGDGAEKDELPFELDKLVLCWQWWEWRVGWLLVVSSSVVDVHRAVNRRDSLLTKMVVGSKREVGTCRQQNHADPEKVPRPMLRH